MNDARFERFTKKLKEGKEGQIVASLIMKNDQIIFSYYKSKKSETSLYPINSCTKSVVSMLFGICMEKGLIKDIHTPVCKFFGEYFVNNKDPRKEQITLYHLLSMTPGLDWPEFGEWNFGSPMEYSKDIIQFVLDRDLQVNPGTQMNYSSGCSNLLSAIIQKLTGMKLSVFVHKQLFNPLGIKEFIWHEKQGICLGANGLKMIPSDMLRLGSLYLHNGQFNGRQLVPREWIEESIKPRFLTYTDIGHYGYHWWMSTHKNNDGQELFYYFALGLYGQFIIVIPEYRVVTVFVSKNYSDTMRPMKLFLDYIFDELA